MTNARFIKSVIKSAEANTTQMPWARGARRAAFIAKRKNDTITPTHLRKSA
ncbi:hypothetical protein [uncultured Tateyamaria sp.]|uniref:hypothetical protein n=1 Tax=uncultured Tateyamaria sp. TaxID=455651 RepID=UPI002614DF40|nr:hypothetical protein [uncultured Tateyamaria sp.]